MGKRRGRGEGTVSKLPSGSYRVQGSLGLDADGQRVRVSVTAPTKGEALARYRERMIELGAAGSATSARDRGLTVSQWVRQWIASGVGQWSTGTVRYRTNRSRRSVESMPIGSTRLASLTRRNVCDWMAALEAAGRPTAERGATLQMLKTALNVAVERELIRASPASSVRAPTHRRKDKRALASAQAREFLRCAEVEGLGLYVALAIDTGCRPSELLALRRGDLLPDGRTLDVRRSLDMDSGEEKGTKTAAGRRKILLAPETAARLDLGLPTDARLIPREEGRWDYYVWLMPRFERVAVRAGVAWATPYTLRHTAATLLLSAGVPITAVAARLGHRSPAVTLQHYAHALPCDQERAAEAITSILWGTR